jgi:hypothetical protein
MNDFLTKAGVSSINTWNAGAMAGDQWAKTQIQAARVIIASVAYKTGWGHLTVIKGYKELSTGLEMVLNDPYGQFSPGRSPYEWGWYDGSGARMMYGSMGVSAMWSYAP